MKVLFASPQCLLDPSSGASLSCRSILQGLAARGHSVQAVSATVFDVPRFSTAKEFLRHIGARAPSVSTSRNSNVWRLERDGVRYRILSSLAQRRLNMSCAEEMLYQNIFKNSVKRMQPDFVLVYGGWPLERDCYRWLKDKNIPSIFYLANPNYNSPDTFRDIHTIITDSGATAELYKKRLGLSLVPFGKFVAPVKVDSKAQRKFVTFINPSREKGVSVFIGIAAEAKRRGLDVQFLVVESKSKLADAVNALGRTMGDFPGITRIPLQEDMNKVWSRTRVLLSPSLWHESGPRTVVEACSAEIPVIATDSGGAPEFLGDCGFLFPIPAEVKSEHSNPINDQTARAWTDVLEKLLSDEAFYDKARARAGARWQVLREREPVARLETLLLGILDGSTKTLGD